MDSSKSGLDAKLVALLEKQKRDLVLRVLEKHEEAERAKVFSEKILASIPDLFFVLNSDFQLIKANEEFMRVLGYRVADNAKLSLARIVGRDDFLLIREKLAAGEFKNHETALGSRSGEQIRVSMNGTTLVTESGRILHMMIAKDTSDLHKMMNHMRDAQEQLIHSGRLASLGEMAAGIGHELTQPLNAILLFARNCIKCLENPEKNRSLLEENLQVIIDRVQKAAFIINSLKSFARKEVPDPAPVQLNLILGNIMRFLDSQLKLSDIACDLHFSDRLPPVLGQEVRLEQVFLNILQNAILAMGETENPVMSISTYLEKNIEPETLNEKEYVVAAVRDNGEGIAPDKLGRIFDPFFSARRVGHGMGLGLSIVDRIVRSYNGFVKVESQEGVGSCFFVYLPACLVEDHCDG